MQQLITNLLLSLYIVLVCYSDTRYKTIYNWLTLPFAIAGIAVNIINSGLNGFVFSFLGMLAGLVILILPFKRGWVGGGDVKFLSSAGAFLGPEAIIFATLYGLILFGGAALVYLLARRRIKVFLSQLLLLFLAGKAVKGDDVIEVSGRLPMGVFFGIGILLVHFFPFLCLL